MEAIDTILQRLHITRADHLPIVAAFCRRIGLIDTINGLVPTDMDVDVGTIVQGMVLDTLSGRSPLYRLTEFFEHQDTELLLGRDVSPVSFNDSTVARAMDAIFDVGTQSVFGEVAFGAARVFPLDMTHVHFDTTSVNVWGDYATCQDDDTRLNVTYGKSKDHRPDLKQFLIDMLCVNRNIPILGGCQDGNASDKTLNNNVLTRIARHMARYGLGQDEFLYVADCAMVTEDNLALMVGNRFVTRLPFTYKEASRVVAEAVAEDVWEQIGTLNETPVTASRPAAVYRAAEKTVTLYGRQYRALVIHSSAHDRRRTRRLERELGRSEQSLRELLAAETRQEYACRPDAEAAADRLRATTTDLHGLDITVEERVRYAPGRPPRNGPRRIASVRFVLQGDVIEKPNEIQRRREEAGCFVLLTNVPRDGDRPMSAAQLLNAYKEQFGIEHNFSFLKDPLVVNDMFVKKPERIEVLGMILLIALLIWNLIEHTLRQHVAATQQPLPGWDGKPTKRPTAFMMSTKFTGIQIARIGNQRQMAQPLTPTQQQYLRALGLTERDLISPSGGSG